MNIQKAPCLAYVIQSDYPENIGAVVEVIYLAPIDARDDPDVPEWVCISPQALMSQDRSLGNLEFPNHEVCILDAWLRPISGIPVTDDVADEVTA